MTKGEHLGAKVKAGVERVAFVEGRMVTKIKLPTGTELKEVLCLKR